MSRSWCEVETVCITGIPLAFMVWCTEYVIAGSGTDDAYRNVGWVKFALIRCEYDTFDTDLGELCNKTFVG
jgi:hypothetical protein